MSRNTIVTLRPSAEATARLIWLPHAGGSAAFYHELSGLLPDSIECRAVEYPGRGRRFGQPFAKDLMAVVGEIAAAFAALPADLPIVLFGHSMGALIGFELCRQLRSTGSKLLPKLLIVSACEPLHVKRVLPLLHVLPDNELVAELMALSGETSAGDLAKDLISINLPVIRSDLTMGETHRFIPYSLPRQEVAVYAGTQDKVVRLETLKHWRLLCGGVETFRNFDGGHFYMLEQRPTFIAKLSEDIFAAAGD